MMRTLLLSLFLLGNALAAAQAPDAEPAADEAEQFQRVVPVFDPGSHTRPISALAFTPDRSKLITVGDDFTIQIWRVATGERLEILRLPPYGQGTGENANLWDVSAISPDGTLVAVGGAPKKFSDERPVKLILVNLVQKTIRKIAVGNDKVSALAFSPDSKRLAVGFTGKGATTRLFSVDGDNDRDLTLRRSIALEDDQPSKPINVLAFNPAGTRLAASAAHSGNQLQVWDVTPGAKPKLLARPESKGATTAMVWSADGKHIARCWTAFLDNPRGFGVLTEKGETVKEVLFAEHPFWNARGIHPFGIQFVGPERLLLSIYAGREVGDGERERGCSLVQFDLKTNQAQELYRDPSDPLHMTRSAITPDGQGAAVLVSMGLDAEVIRLSDRKVISRCGASSPIPARVGWSAKGKPVGFAWNESPRRNKRSATKPEDLEFGFNLEAMEPTAEFRPTDYVVGLSDSGEYSTKHQVNSGVTVNRGAEEAGRFKGGAAITAYSLVPQADKPPLFAFGHRRLVQASGDLVLSRLDGTEVNKFLPHFVNFQDIAPSPEGRYLVASTGTHRVCVYATEGPRLPLLSFARVNGEWLAWSAEGYYTASPGGEKMIGWAVNNGPEQFAAFYSADKFSKQFRRPDILAKAIELGSVAKAVAALGSETAVAERHLPPAAELRLVRQTGAKIQVHATATPGVDKKPVIALRLLLNGRPLAAGNGVKEIAPGEPAVADWNLEIPAGAHELKLLARSEDGAAVSPPLAVTGPKSADQQPTLFRLCVGVNQYQAESLRLSAAAGDASRVFAGLEEYCVGPKNRFGVAKGKLLVDREVTRKSVLEQLALIRREAKPGDLVVFHFAGHGIKQRVERKGKAVEDYFLLTSEADPNRSLEGASLSGEDLRAALAPMECPVLLALDACHSARGVKAFRPATDDVARNLTDDSAGVTVLAAAMAHEVAIESKENGYFSAALLKALQAGEGVPYDPEEHAIYTHHLYSVVFSEVRRKTNGKQNPFLNMPWTVPPQIVRETDKSARP